MLFQPPCVHASALRHRNALHSATYLEPCNHHAPGKHPPTLNNIQSNPRSRKDRLYNLKPRTFSTLAFPAASATQVCVLLLDSSQHEIWGTFGKLFIRCRPRPILLKVALARSDSNKAFIENPLLEQCRLPLSCVLVGGTCTFSTTLI